MDFKVRLMKMDRLISEKGVVTFEELQRATGAAPATVKRDIRYMREELKAPITYSRTRGGYLFAKNRAEAKRDDFYDRRSMWFTPDELHCMVKTLNNFSELEKNRQGYLVKDLQQMASRRRSSMFVEEANAEELLKRVVINEPQRKPFKSECFEVLGQALVHRQRVRIVYYSDHKREETRRVISPMRLVYYRQRWYLDAWCHERGALRSFNVENIRHADIMQMTVKIVPMKTVRETLDNIYGMYHSENVQWARIRFMGASAKRASQLIWHKDQFERWLKEDVYELNIPFGENSPELVGDILNYGAEACVMEPESLKEAVKAQLKATLKNYE